jgi:hypothetical protein
MLTTPQLIALKSLAAADPTAAFYQSEGNDVALAEWFNTQSATVVWRSALTPELARAAIVQGATQLDNLTVGKRDALLYITQGSLDVANVSVRTAIDDLCGTQNTLKTALQAAQKRFATRAEAALASGLGTSVSPSVMAWEGMISSQIEVPAMRGV